MSDYYHQFLASMSGVGPHPHHMQQQPQQQHQQQHQPMPLHHQPHLPQQHPPPPQHMHEMMPLSLPPHLHQPPIMAMDMGMGPSPGPGTNQYQNLGFYTGFPEPVMFNAQKSQRNRRKSAPGAEHVKHRRTRSDTSNEEDDDDVDQDGKLDTILDDEDAEESTDAAVDMSAPQLFTVTLNDKVRPPLRQSSSTSLLNMKRAAGAAGAGASTARQARQSSETPSLEGKGSSPATSTGTANSFPQTAHSVASSEQLYSAPSNITGISAADWSHLPQDIRFFLGYFLDNITHFHYCLPTDSDNFILGTLPGLAIRNEPLLYALVAFSSYHYILRNPSGKLQQFLHYYDQSVRLLLGILKRKEKHQIGTLLTVLQLATIEEYLGDWVNLMGHQKAALEMLTEIYTPETSARTPTSRMVVHWYSRFDVFVGIMGGFETALSRDWFTTIVAHYQASLASEPTSLVYKVEECSARLRLISLEMSMLYARAKEDDGEALTTAGGGGLSAFPSFAPDEAFMREHARILGALHEWKHSLDAIVQVDGKPDQMDTGEPEFNHHPLLVTDFSHAKPVSEDDIVDPYQPGVLYCEPLFAVTIMTCEWQSIIVMHEMQAAQLAMAAMGATPQPTGGASPLPQGMSLPPGMSLPEGMTLPEGMSLPPGMSLPEGMTLPDGMLLPEGMTADAAMAAVTGASPENLAAMKAAAANLSPGGATAAAGGPEEQAISAQMSAGLAGLAKRAYAICQIFETLEMWPASPPGCLIISQAMIAMAALFLPRDARHHMWIRRKFALIETMGYIFPLTMRTRMAELFNDPSCVQWWLPNNEGFSPILQSVRAFADERNVTAVSAQTENLRKIRHIFAKLQIGEGDSNNSGGATTAAAVETDSLHAGDSDAGNWAGSTAKSKGVKGAKGGKGKRKGV
ncbi:hypothetical protein SEUCBS139899_002673 [Sporothrix eucalyptigena]